jgi:hypothetical protein
MCATAVQSNCDAATPMKFAISRLQELKESSPGQNLLQNRVPVPKPDKIAFDAYFLNGILQGK